MNNRTWLLCECYDLQTIDNKKSYLFQLCIPICASHTSSLNWTCYSQNSASIMYHSRVTLQP